MATVFPSIKPSSRSFTPPAFATTTSSSQSGVVTRRLWGSRPSKAVLALQFDNIDDSETSAILKAYNDAKGSVDSLVLPDEVFAGTDRALQQWLDGSNTGAGLLWCFTEGSAPQVVTTSVGRSNVQVNLTAELRIS